MTSSPRRKLHSETAEQADLMERVESASDGSTTEDDRVQCKLKTMHEQHRAMLRKSGNQLFMDEVHQLRRVSCLEDESSGAVGLPRDNCPPLSWFQVSCALWCPWRRRDSHVSDKINQKVYRGRRLVRATLKLATQLLDTGGLSVWECSRSCQAWKLPDVLDALWNSVVVF